MLGFVVEVSTDSEFSKARLFVAIISPPVTGTVETTGFVWLLS